MGVIYKGRELASNQCKIRIEVIDGKEVEALYDIPRSWTKLKYKDEQPDDNEEKKTTYKMSAERGQLLYAILNELQSQGENAIIYKTKVGKYACEVRKDKWFSVGITENRKVPEGQEKWSDPKDKTIKGKLFTALTETLSLFGEVQRIKGAWCVLSNDKWFTLTITENRSEPSDKKEFNDHKGVA